jgi:hypothetical protein
VAEVLLVYDLRGLKDKLELLVEIIDKYSG